jgi:signal transduction histidine kinase
MGDMGTTGPVNPMIALTRAALQAPFGRRARRELLFCLVGVLVGLAVLAVVVALLVPGTAESVIRAAVVTAVLLPLALAIGMARRLGAAHRRLAERLLGERVAPPPDRPRRGWPGRLGAGLRDGPGWRALAYTLLKLPMAAAGLYAVFLWAAGLANLTYPFWWGLFRNHPPGVRLSPVLVATPFPGRVLHVATYPGTFLAFAIGAAMVLAAPWVTRGVVAADRRLLRGLLGPGRLAERVRDLEQTRAAAVDDSAALLRQVERDLHDGAQIRLATLAMHLGMAKEKLGDDGDPLDVAGARELVDAAHRGAKDALAELRDLARGIHPPVLDNGLADALATLAAGSAIPVELAADIPVRPTPAIETIAYFCAAELLANAAKHSQATRIGLEAAGRDGRLLLSVTDDGAGGADPGGSGLSGLAQRVSTVDGRLEIASPPGGPTRVTVELPLRA